PHPSSLFNSNNFLFTVNPPLTVDEDPRTFSRLTVPLGQSSGEQGRLAWVRHSPRGLHARVAHRRWTRWRRSRSLHPWRDIPSTSASGAATSRWSPTGLHPQMGQGGSPLHHSIASSGFPTRSPCDTANQG